MNMKKKIIEINGSEIHVKELEILKFQKEIECLVVKEGLGYFESIMEYCEKYSIEIETVRPLISENLLSRLHEEASDLNLIRRTGSSLPI